MPQKPNNQTPPPPPKRKKSKVQIQSASVIYLLLIPHYPEGNTCSFLYGYGQLKRNEICW